MKYRCHTCKQERPKDDFDREAGGTPGTKCRNCQLDERRELLNSLVLIVQGEDVQLVQLPRKTQLQGVIG